MRLLRFYCFPTWRTCRRAKAWLSAEKVKYEYRDILKEPLSGGELAELAAGAGIKVADLVNPKSAGFKKLGLEPESIDDTRAAELISEYPKIMRRPLLYDGENVVVGFNEDQYHKLI